MRRYRVWRKRSAYLAKSRLATIEDKHRGKIILCRSLCFYCRDINDGIAGLDQEAQLDRKLVSSMENETAKIRRKLHLVVKEIRFFSR